MTSINLEVDYNGPNVAGGFTTLVFEPVYNTTQGAIVDGVWQTWDAYQGGNAIWWSSKDIPGVCAFNCFVAWKDIVLANPDATILGGVGLNQGSGNPALTNAVDAFVVGIGGTTTTYNFELFVTASSKDQCKNGGWQNVKRGDGSAFKNQGDWRLLRAERQVKRLKPGFRRSVPGPTPRTARRSSGYCSSSASSLFCLPAIRRRRRTALLWVSD